MTGRTTLMALLAAGFLSLTLFAVSYQVRDMEAELRSLGRSMAEDRQAIHVLRAEWSALNTPARLRELAERHLELMPMESGQVATFERMPLPASSLEGGAR